MAKRKKYIFLFWCYLPTICISQNLGIGMSAFLPSSSTILEIRSTESGLLVPRMTSVQRNSISPDLNSDYGLLIYQTDIDTGFHYWDGSQWILLANEKSSWLTKGNPETSVLNNYLGTKDDEGLRFRTNNTQRLTIDTLGNVGIGVGDPSEELEIKGQLEIIGTAAANNARLSFSHVDKSDRFQIQTDLHTSSPNNDVLSIRSINQNNILNVRGNRCVGILKKSPSEPLEVYHPGSNGTEIRLSNGGNGYHAGIVNIIGHWTIRGGGYIYHNSPNNYQWLTGYSYANPDQFVIRRLPATSSSSVQLFNPSASGLQTFFTITKTGKVGIGNKNPTSALVVGNGFVQLSSDVTPTHNYGLEAGHNGIAGTILSYDRDSLTHKALRINANNIGLLTSGAYSIVIDSLSKVGIGAIPPKEKLDVNGNMRIRDSLQIGNGIKIARHLGATLSWDPMNLPFDGNSTTQNISVPGASVGDLVNVGHSSIATAGAILMGVVQATDLVSVTLLNKTGASYDALTGTLRVGVWKY